MIVRVMMLMALLAAPLTGLASSLANAGAAPGDPLSLLLCAPSRADAGGEDDDPAPAPAPPAACHGPYCALNRKATGAPRLG